MIFDKLENAKNYESLNTGFKKAFEFLSRPDIAELECKKYEIDGTNVFAMITDKPGKNKEEAKLEAHNKYIDIQFLIKGSEEIGWKARVDCKAIAVPFNAEKDIEFYSDKAQTYFSFSPFDFAVFFPEDAHAPMVSETNVHKVVIKVKA